MFRQKVGHLQANKWHKDEIYVACWPEDDQPMNGTRNHEI
jgi:hypothetical protein